MAMSKNGFMAVLVIIAVVIALAVLIFVKQTEKGDGGFAGRASCQQRLRALGYAYRMYSGNSFYGTPPDRLTSLVDDLVIPFTDYDLLSCPKYGIQPPPQRDSFHTYPGNYIMVDWSRLSVTEVPDDFPLMFDCRLENHDGAGVNVLLMDGTVRWDEKGKFLSDFARKYPDMALPKGIERP